jgi:2-hydroxychromene-2-carboxylate isomerase/predicted thioesterase
MRPVAPGTTGEHVVVPTPAHTAAAIGNVGVAAVSTPAVLGFLEQASLEAIARCLEPGEISVGAEVELRHRAPAFPGRLLVARAVVESVEGRSIRFTLEARQGDVLVAEGRYRRVVVATQGFHTDAADAVPRELLTFWFDVHSPWAYLAARRLPALAARHGRTVRWVPIHVVRLIEAIGGRRPLEESPAFVAWYRQDLRDWAALAGVPLRYHPDFPLRPARALRAATHALGREQGPAFVLAVMRAYWEEARDISDPAVLAELGGDVGLDPGEIRAATGSESCKAAVEAATQDAIARGVFGVPTVGVGDKLYFGQDRLDLLDLHLTASTGG